MSDASLARPDIEKLPRLVAALSAQDQERFRDLFAIVSDAGEMELPPTMHAWVRSQFGSPEAVRRQRVVRVTNRWTHEGTTFNPLRALRPSAGLLSDPSRLAAIRERIEQARGDDFCHVLEKTPADVFGRISGRACRTAANVARADGWHGLVVFDEHDPLALSTDQIADGMFVAREWAKRAHALQPEARYPFVVWNCLWRAGASQPHAHLQVFLSKTMPQARVELWRAAAESYRAATGRPYFGDLADCHQALGLAHGDIPTFASLTPVKERESITLAPGSLWSKPTARKGASAAWQTLAHDIGRLVTTYRRLGVLAFDLALFGPPLGGGDGWADFPTVVRLVDRGDPSSDTADVAAMELFGSSVVATDPFAFARAVSAESYTQSA